MWRDKHDEIVPHVLQFIVSPYLMGSLIYFRKQDTFCTVKDFIIIFVLPSFSELSKHFANDLKGIILFCCVLCETHRPRSDRASAEWVNRVGYSDILSFENVSFNGGNWPSVEGNNSEKSSTSEPTTDSETWVDIISKVWSDEQFHSFRCEYLNSVKCFWWSYYFYENAFCGSESQPAVKILVFCTFYRHFRLQKADDIVQPSVAWSRLLCNTATSYKSRYPQLSEKQSLILIVTLERIQLFHKI